MHMAELMPLPLTLSCFSEIQIGFIFLVPAHLDSPRKRAVKRVCVCVLPVLSDLMTKERLSIAPEVTALIFKCHAGGAFGKFGFDDENEAEIA